jgi:hypothetical protein
VCDRLYYDKSGFNKHLPRNVDCARARSFRSVIPREGTAIESSSGNDDEPFPVSVSSVAAALEVQVSHGQSRHVQPHVVEEDEYGPKKGVRCLICKTLFCDKSGYNKHLSQPLRRGDCGRARSFRIVHKRQFVDEEEAQTAKAAFRDADAVHTS